MNIERIGDDRTTAYVPAFGGEREKSEARADYPAATFHLRPMTAAEYEEAGELARRGEGAGAEVCYRLRPAEEAAVLTRHVIRIENLAFADGAPIGDGRAFAAARTQVSGALAPLYLEILAAVRDISILREGERKN